jgi:hypothetical protein
MANRFSYGDTLGGQLYTQYVRDSTNRYLQEKALEEERQRREAERRRQEKQRKKASDHGAFGQTLQTIGQIGGAIAGGMITKTPQGAIAGSQLGSAGASTIMNLFPNVGGTEPDGSNPYYDKPSDMAKLGSTINTGLQAYGMYTDSAKPKAREEVTNRLTSEMNSGVTWDDNGQTLSYYSASPEQLAARIEGFDEYKNATGIFGEDLLKGSSLSIANTINSGIRQSILPQVEFTNSLPDSEQKRQVLTNLQNKYGQNLTNLLPEGSLQAMDAGVQQNIQKANRTTVQEQTAEFDRLAKVALESAKMGSYDASVFTTDVADANPELAQQYKALADSYVREATLKKQNAQTKATLEIQKDRYELSLKALENTPKDSEVHSTLVDITAGLAEDVVGIPDGQALFSQLGKDVKAADDPTEKGIQANAEKFVNALMNPNLSTGRALTKEEAIAVILNTQAQKDSQGNFRRETLSPIGEAMLRQLVKEPDIENEINSINLTNAYESAQKKQREKLNLWNRTVDAVGGFLGFGESGPDVSETQLNNNASATGNQALLNDVFSNVPSLNGQ